MDGQGNAGQDLQNPQGTGQPQGDVNGVGGNATGMGNGAGSAGQQNNAQGTVLGQTAPQTNTAPEKYDYEVPETWSEEYKAYVENLARENKLNNEQMKSFVAYSKKEHEKHVQETNAQIEKWENELKQDPDFAGENWNNAVQYARKGLEHMDTTGELKQILEQSGYGSHPSVVRHFMQIGKMLDNDGFKKGGNGGNYTDNPLEERLYKD